MDKGLELLSSIDNIPRKLFARLQAHLFYWKGAILVNIGDIEKGQDFLRNSTSLADESGDKFLLVHCYIVNASICFNTSDYSKGLEYLGKGKEIATKLGNKFLLAYYYQTLANAKSIKLEYEEAIESLKKTLALSKEIGSSLFNDSIRLIGVYYRFMYNLDDALKYFEESLNYSGLRKFLIHFNIGNTYFLKYELERAQDNLLKSVEISERIGEKRLLPYTLYTLIRISIEQNDIPEAKKYLTRLEQLETETSFTHINRIYRFASILIFNASSEINDLAEAVILLNSLLDEQDLPSEWRLNVLFLLLDIRIKELQLSATKEALEEAKKQAIRLEVETSEQKLHSFLADVYRLQSQLALVELNLEEAIDFLDKAKAIADEIDVEFLKKKIRRDREKIDQQLVEFQKFQEQKAPLSETIKLTSLENTVQKIKQETILEKRDKETGKIIEYRKLFTIRI
ncbi:MAG: hypothetical protein FK732_04020 [Asgard group archaeon]|nr:hypothetical protein [Asgard group archaeon]